ncbi:DUF4079 domain-containing protein [Limnofasciculus baicalensis]|uniref:DUF4079 domain-containing protein n=1 Tax=Limnofasciculus baicalensis BBK-W-15 TaxID=2699891 RepID=A0AAE3GZ03_9CYAN|nr:DUF4079 domain-containing protein [Limnofasciculus baicalensis]MCP2732423.1 DUF4079 domain-containing protein [Limnofasciculus baicalensis BBK-W-15]
MHLPSFLWLWKIAAWSMGLSLFAYLLLAITGSFIFSKRQSHHPKPQWLPISHYIIGWIMVGLVLLLLGIGIVGTIGHYGNLGHSGHFIAGWSVVVLVLVSAASATQITPQRHWVRAVHVGTNIALLVGLAWVSFTGWQVVQKFLS